MSNIHKLLTDQGVCTHEHTEDDFDDGDPENGPGSGGHEAFDVYSCDSHDIIVQRGLIVDMQIIDWDEMRFFERMGH